MTAPDQSEERAKAQRAFALDLARRFPCLKPFRQDNTGADDGVLLSYMMFADMCDAMIEGRVGDDDTTGILAHLDAHTGDGDDAVSNLIVLGFVEYISPSDASHAKLLSQLGPKMRKRHRRWWNY